MMMKPTKVGSKFLDIGLNRPQLILSYLLVQKNNDLNKDRVNEENEDSWTWFVVGYLINNIWTPEKDYQRSFAQERHGPMKKLKM